MVGLIGYHGVGMKFIGRVVKQHESILVYIPKSANLLGLEAGEQIEVSIKRTTGSTGNLPPG